ncbi:hypothetical protein N7540_005850 [Penicillium herquei]|nr:hypothetical protein N7540_005850 [Penicillium herquei]
MTKESNDRLLEIRRITRALQDSREDPSVKIEISETLISLYKQERLYNPLSTANRLAALSYCAAGQRWNTIKYARLAVEAGILANGFEDEDVKSMRELAEEPELCWTHRVMN